VTIVRVVRHGRPATTTDEAEWTEDSTASGVQLAENFPLTTYADRGALLSAYEAIDAADPLPQNGVQNTFYPGYTSATKYDDPPPGGATPKLLLDTSNWVTGGQALRLVMLAAEGNSEAGPVLEIPVSGTPPTEYYLRMVWKPTHASVLTHDYNGSHRKLCWLNHFGPGNGQIVGTLYQDVGPWVSGFRIDGSGSRGFLLDHGSFIDGRRRQLFGGWDTDIGGATPTTDSQWDARWGPSANETGNVEQTDANFASIHRPSHSEWFVTMWYVNLLYSGTTSAGMFKSWNAPKGSAPQLQMLHVDDCAFLSSAAPESIRVVFRPEDCLNFNPDDAGILIDSVLLRSGPTAPLFPGRFVVPHQSTTIPTGFPISGCTDD
jgi:hypothetical protein